MTGGNFPASIQSLLSNKKKKQEPEEDLTAMEKMILQNPMYESLMPEKVKKIKKSTKKCKSLEEDYAQDYKQNNNFSSKQKKRLREICGSVPDGKLSLFYPSPNPNIKITICSS